MSDLMQFLLARIAEDEAVANAATPGPWLHRYHSGASGDVSLIVAEGRCFPAECADINADRDAEHIAQHDPARVLAECQAKRRIVDSWDEAPWVRPLLAMPYADHPEFRPEWRVKR